MAHNLPSLVEYLDAVQNPHVHFADLSLKSANYASTALGQPLAETGGFALTFVASCNDGQKRAVRCFHKFSENIHGRYQSIAQEVKGLSPQYFVNFEFQKEGIQVAGQWYPVVKMDWAVGETLGVFLANNYNNGYQLTNLRNSLSELARYLEAKGVAHGDISDGNIMVSDQGKAIKLIDYDGMYVPSLANMPPAELGNPNFQHSGRDSSIWNNKLDRFSFIFLDVVIECLIHDAGLWVETKSDSSSFLFRSGDFSNIGQSDTRKKLTRIPALHDTTIKFASVCGDSISGVPSLDVFQTTYQAKVVKSNEANSEPQRYRSAYPVIAAREYNTVREFVGDKVELIGRIVEVKEGMTKYGKKYLFVNFAPWKGETVKISIWSDGLSRIANPPDVRDVGKWVSVIGLVEPPYINQRYGYTHLSLTVRNESEINFLTESEASYRLGGPKNKTQETRPQNCSTSPSKGFGEVGQTNKERLDYINSLTQGKNRSATPSKSQSSSHQPKRQPQGSKKSAVGGSNQTGAKDSEVLESFGCLFCIIGFVIALFAKAEFGGTFWVWFVVSTILTGVVGTCLVHAAKSK